MLLSSHSCHPKVYAATRAREREAAESFLNPASDFLWNPRSIAATGRNLPSLQVLKRRKSQGNRPAVQVDAASDVLGSQLQRRDTGSTRCRSGRPMPLTL